MILGIIIYSLDLCRMFKHCIKNMPTNLMTRYYPFLFPADKESENEHLYYEWYENSPLQSRVKTELQSGLYHFTINIASVSLLGILFGTIILVLRNDSFVIILNVILLFLSALAAITLVKKRLNKQWLRNYWEFERDFIKKRAKV